MRYNSIFNSRRIVALVIFLLILTLIWIFQNQARVNQIMTFHSSDNSFTFNYPEFQSWEVQNIENFQNYTVISLNYPPTINSKKLPQISINILNAELKYTNLLGTQQSKINPNQVKYYYVKYRKNNLINGLIFINDKKVVEINSLSVPDSLSFSQKRFKKEVIKSFKFLSD